MGKEFPKLQKRLQDIESQILPILSLPPNPDTTLSDQPVPNELNKQLLFLNKVITTEMAQAQTPGGDHLHHLGDIANRVRLLQKALHAWTSGQPAEASIEPGTTSSYCCTVSCVDDDNVSDDDDGHDHEEGEEFPLVGYKVYGNTMFVIDDDDDCDGKEGRDVHEDDGMGVFEGYEGDQEKAEELGGVTHDEEEEEEEEENEHEEKEVITSDDEIAEKNEKVEEEEEDDDDTTENNCFRIVFGVTMIGMGVFFLLAGFSDFSDDHHSVYFLTPT